MGLLLSRLVHDLKNPLAAALSNLGFLEPRMSGTDNREALEESLVALGRLDRMLDDAVDLGRIRAGTLSVLRAPVALADLADDLAQDLALLSWRRTLSFEPGQARLLTDGRLLRRVLIDLLEHALRQTPSRGTVRMVGALEEQGFVLRVIDGGASFAPEVQPSFLDDQLPLMEPPSAGHRSDQGLGLHFAGVMARALGARTAVLAREDGERGVVFELVFPAELVT